MKDGTKNFFVSLTYLNIFLGSPFLSYLIKITLQSISHPSTSHQWLQETKVAYSTVMIHDFMESLSTLVLNASCWKPRAVSQLTQEFFVWSNRPERESKSLKQKGFPWLEECAKTNANVNPAAAVCPGLQLLKSHCCWTDKGQEQSLLSLSIHCYQILWNRGTCSWVSIPNWVCNPFASPGFTSCFFSQVNTMTSKRIT